MAVLACLSCGTSLLACEVINAGRMAIYELQHWHYGIYPGIYVPRCSGTHAARLRYRRLAGLVRSKAVLAGAAASSIDCAQWVDDGFAVELIGPSTRPQRGLIVLQRGRGRRPDQPCRPPGAARHYVGQHGV